jgi:hypothetical protein
MKIHPKMMIVQKAKAEIGIYLCDYQEKHNLTDIEMLQIINSVSDSTLKFMLRRERHPNNPDKPADQL